VHYLATALYIAYAGSKRANIKDAIRASSLTLNAEAVYDSSLASTPGECGPCIMMMITLPRLYHITNEAEGIGRQQASLC